MLRIGFIGTGMMGREMARRLLEAGHPLAVWNRSREKAQALVTAGAAWVDSPRAAAEWSEVVITMVTDSAASEAVICGPDGVLEGARPGLVLADMGSIAPEMSRAIAGRAKARGVPMLDAPVTGNPRVAADGKLGVMVGGSPEAFEACRPIFETLASKIVYVGRENGMGTTLKLINNLILGVAIEAVAEALLFAERVGIDPQRVVEITSVGGARTSAMETRGTRMIKRDFSPHFSTSNMHKDLTTAIALAESVGAPLPAARAAQVILAAAKSQGKGDLDSSVVLAVLESMREPPTV